MERKTCISYFITPAYVGLKYVFGRILYFQLLHVLNVLCDPFPEVTPKYLIAKHSSKGILGGVICTLSLSGDSQDDQKRCTNSYP